jgi:hypothetical protein
MAATDTETTEGVDSPSHTRWRFVRRVAVLTVVGLMVAMWAGIFLGFFDKTAPGTLNDATFSNRAAPLCTAAQAQLAALPKAFETRDHVERAKVVAQTNTILRGLIEQLRAFAPTTDRDGRMTQEWLDDWSTYISDREDYAARLSADSSARFYESTKSSDTEQISKPIDRFAYVNNMDDCNTPQDMS